MITILEYGQQHLAAISIQSKLLQNNIIQIEGEIDDKMAVDVKSAILYLINKSPTPTIHLHINSPGGSIYAGLGILGMIKLAQSKGIIVETTCTGSAMSMAFVLMIAGTKGHRRAVSYSTFMGHHASAGCVGNVQDLAISLKEAERLNNILMSFIKDNTLISNPKEFFNRDVYIDNEEALKLGIINTIL